MELRQASVSKELLLIDSSALDKKFVVNNNIPSLDELRRNFKPVKSSVLGNVQNFLPKIASANEELKRKMENNPENCFDIESVMDGNPYIEMNLALVECNYTDSDDCTDDDGDDDDRDCDTEDSVDVVGNGSVTEHNLKLSNRKSFRKPLIETVDKPECDHGENSDSTNSSVH